MKPSDFEPFDTRAISLEPPIGTRLVCHEVVERKDTEKIGAVREEITNMLAGVIQHEEVDCDNEHGNSVRVQADIVAMSTWRYRDEIARAYDMGCMAGSRALVWKTPEEMAADEPGAIARNVARLLAGQNFTDEVREILFGILCKLAHNQEQRLTATKQATMERVAELCGEVCGLGYTFGVHLEDAGIVISRLETILNGLDSLKEAAISGDLEQVQVAMTGFVASLTGIKVTAEQQAAQP